MSEADQQFWPLQQAGCPTPKDGTPHMDLEPDPRLVAEGWQRRFMADPTRIKEALQLYTDLGYEVRLEAVQPAELSLACGDCRLATCRAYQTIYTRKKVPAADV
jgi:hypothetical protein